MKIVFKIKEDDARNPGVIADCVGDNAGDSVGPLGRRLRDLRRDGRRAHHVHPARGRPRACRSSSSLVWIFDAHHHGHRLGRLVLRQRGMSPRPSTPTPTKMNFEHPLTQLVVSPRSSRSPSPSSLVPPHPRPRANHAVVEALGHHHVRHARRRDHPRAHQGLHLHRVRATCAKSSRRPSRAAPRSTSSRASSPATSRRTGWASSSSSSWARVLHRHDRAPRPRQRS
jgi:hypothetical protein